MNPILPKHYYIPDVEARQWQDGRMYLYGSYDISGDTTYCSRKYHVFSSDDLVHWTDHGPSFKLARSHAQDANRLYAPDCIYKDGQYYLFYCANNGAEGVAVSDRPEGPFDQAWALEGADGDGIDPAVLVDDDGHIYYFWGQFELRGARLTDDLSAIARRTFTPQILTEAAHGFHEGASIRKHDGIYYLVYTDISRGRATSLAYATSTSPLGPYTKRGIIIDNTGCDPETWNNHGSIAPFNGQWYVFYHRASQASRFNRRVCVEPIHFNADGSIDEVPMTTQGVSAPLDATQPVAAYRACLLSGGIRSAPLHRTPANDGYQERLTWIHDGDWAAYKYLGFSEDIQTFCATVGSPKGGGKLEVRSDHRMGPLLCTCDLPNTGGWAMWQTIETTLHLPITGVHAIYLVFKGGRGRLLDILSFSFK